jgi:hypothetical protein
MYDPKCVTRSPPPGLIAQALLTHANKQPHSHLPQQARSQQPPERPLRHRRRGGGGVASGTGRGALLRAQRGWRNSLCMNVVPVQLTAAAPGRPPRSKLRLADVDKRDSQSCTAVATAMQPRASKLHQLLQSSTVSESALELGRSAPSHHDEEDSMPWNSSWSHTKWKKRYGLRMCVYVYVYVYVYVCVVNAYCALVVCVPHVCSQCMPQWCTTCTLFARTCVPLTCSLSCSSQRSMQIEEPGTHSETATGSTATVGAQHG